MKTVLITFAKSPMNDYPLAVVVIDPENRFWWPSHRGQEHLVRSVKDGIIFANGLLTGVRLTNPDDLATWPSHVTFDERLEKPEAFKG